HSQAAETPSNLPNVRQRPDKITTGLCGRCSESDRQSDSTDGTEHSHIRVQRPPRVYIQGASQNARTRGRTEADPDSGSIHRLAGIGLDCGDDVKSTHHSESSGTDAGRQRALVWNARIWRPWNFAARGR